MNSFKRSGEAIDFYLTEASKLDPEWYAIGGAIAQIPCGYSRATSDVDVFLSENYVPKAMRSLRERGFKIREIFDGIHYTAHHPQYADLYPEVRMDLLVPFDDPEWSAVQAPNTAEIAGSVVSVFPPALLALTRFYSEQPRHLQDLAAMINVGGFSLEEARSILQRTDPERLSEWDAVVVSMSKRAKGRRRPQRK